MIVTVVAPPCVVLVAVVVTVWLGTAACRTTANIATAACHPALAQIGTGSSSSPASPPPFALFVFAAVCKLDCSLKAGNCHSLVGQVRRSRGLERSARGVQGAEGRRGDTAVALAALCRAAEGTRSSRCLWSSKAARGPPRAAAGERDNSGTGLQGARGSL